MYILFHDELIYNCDQVNPCQNEMPYTKTFESLRN